jgi:hypothetical protein
VNDLSSKAALFVVLKGNKFCTKGQFPDCWASLTIPVQSVEMSFNRGNRDIE